MSEGGYRSVAYFVNWYASSSYNISMCSHLLQLILIVCITGPSMLESIDRKIFPPIN